MSTLSQTTLQVTATLLSASSDRRWFQLLLVGVVNQPYNWTPASEQPSRADRTVLTCWPANEGVRRHLLGVNQGDLVAVRGELALYEGKQAAAGRRRPATHLGARAEHVWLVAKYRPKGAA